jgi:hypothetical protein
MSGKRRRLSNKEYQRLLRARAKEEEEARSKSEKRQERIKELWGLITSRKLMRGDESEETARDLHNEIAEEVFGEWETKTEKKGGFEKGLRRRDRGDTHQRRSSNKLVRPLAELVALQKVEMNYMRLGHELCEWAKTHAREELDALLRVWRAAAWRVLRRGTKLTPSQAYEQRTLSSGRRDEVGLIEDEFGDHPKARVALYYGPSCLDDILRGDGVDMRYLEILFGMEHHRFPKKLLPSVRDRRKIRYSAFELVKIMDALLKERPTQRKPGARGGSVKKLWPSNPDCRKRVLTGVLCRAYAFSKDRHILAAFATVVWRHLPIEYLKEQLPKGFERVVAALGRRYLD